MPQEIRRNGITIVKETGDEMRAMTAEETLKFRAKTNERLDALEKRIGELEAPPIYKKKVK